MAGLKRALAALTLAWAAWPPQPAWSDAPPAMLLARIYAGDIDVAQYWVSEKFDDAEAVVVGYVPGKGKYLGMTGALLMETPDGGRFRLGSGLSDSLRREPPPVGTRITYRYQHLTKKGLPRFPHYLRVRDAFQGLPAKE